jgi:hypothetical protein
MPTKRQIGVKSLTALTLAQESYLKCGRYYFDWPGGPEEHFARDEEANEAWHAHREKVLGDWDIPGRRPPLFWALDVGLKCVRWPDHWAWPAPYETEADVVRAMLLAGEIEGCWLHAVRCAVQHAHGLPQVDEFALTQWRGVPKWYFNEHVAQVMVEVAAERAAFRRSIAGYMPELDRAVSPQHQRVSARSLSL